MFDASRGACVLANLRAFVVFPGVRVVRSDLEWLCLATFFGSLMFFILCFLWVGGIVLMIVNLAP